MCTPASHLTHNRSFQSWVFSGNQLHWYWQPKTINHNTTYTRNTKEKQKKTALANKTIYTLIWYGFYDLWSGNEVGPILTAPGPTQGITVRILLHTILLKKMHHSWPFLRWSFSTIARPLWRVILLENRKNLDRRNWLGPGSRIHEVYASEFPLTGSVDKHRCGADIVVDQIAVNV